MAINYNSSMFLDHNLKLNCLRLEDEGKTEDYIKGYIRGWRKRPSGYKAPEIKKGVV